MAIKTTGEGANRRIITKLVDGQRRVSCSCCEEAVCCMYPADQLGVGYQEADLPDEVRITIAGTGGDSRIAARSGSEYSYGSYGGIANLKLGVDDGAWVFIPNADNLSAYVQQCLVGEEAEFAVEDTFADTYNISYSNPATASTTVTRESLCVWRGQTTVTIFGNSTPLTVVLEYFNSPDAGAQEDQLKWIVNGDIKIGTQNTPVGSYQSGDATWTVS